MCLWLCHNYKEFEFNTNSYRICKKCDKLQRYYSSWEDGSWYTFGRDNPHLERHIKYAVLQGPLPRVYKTGNSGFDKHAEETLLTLKKEREDFLEFIEKKAEDAETALYTEFKEQREKQDG